MMFRHWTICVSPTATGGVDQVLFMSFASAGWALQFNYHAQLGTPDCTIGPLFSVSRSLTADSQSNKGILVWAKHPVSTGRVLAVAQTNLKPLTAG
jgi:hypothetical protein